MATYNLRRFAHPEGLKAITPKHLLALLKPHESYFDSRGIVLSSSSATDGLDYDQLVEVLMTPGSDTPAGLIDALFYVHEMSTQECMDVLLEEVENNGISLEENPDPTAADIAVQVYLQDKDILERKHAEQYLVKPRLFEYFQTELRPIPVFKQPSTDVLAALEKDLDDWFEKKKRGRGSRVFVFQKTDSVWFLVRHGDPYKREGSLEGDQSSSVFYRPEKYDILVYEPAIGEIRMHACSKGEKETLRCQFGLHLFNNEDFFPGLGKYTLKPLQTSGEASIVCTDVDGIEMVRLKEIQFYWGGAEGEIEIRKADDVFAAYAGRDRIMPQKARIIRASFKVKFTGTKVARTVVIRPPNLAQYSRDDDASVVEEWLKKRGFIVSDQKEDES